MGKYSKYIRFGHGRSDLTLLYGDAATLKEVSHELSAPFIDKKISKVAALDAQGFALGALVAMQLNAGLVFIRKEGKIAWEKQSVTIKDYSGEQKTLEIAINALSKKDRVLIVDDWSETGAQLRGAISLVEQCEAIVVGAAAINMDDKVLHDENLSRYMLHYVELCR